MTMFAAIRETLIDLTRPLLLLAVAAVLSLLGACSAPRATSGGALLRVEPGPGIHDKELEMYRRLNADRANQSLYPLVFDERLADAARGHSADMRKHRFFAHESPTHGAPSDRLIAAGIFFRTVRENLADAPDVRTAEDGLLKSPKHYANITSTDVTHIGIGIVQGGVDDPDNILITQDFAHLWTPESADAARGRIVRIVNSARARLGLRALAPGGPMDSLAAEQTRRLPVPLDSGGLRRAGQSIKESLKNHPVKGVKGFSVDGQTLQESASFKIPPALLQRQARPYGLAVREARDKGQPLLLILVVVAE
jgi:uncharacterized protein YkwD